MTSVAKKISVHQTEKTFSLQEKNVLVMLASVDCIKKDIILYVKENFSTEVLSISSVVVKGKIKRYKNNLYKRSSLKKFYVKLKDFTKIS